MSPNKCVYLGSWHGFSLLPGLWERSLKAIALGDAENTQICCFPDASRQGVEPGYLRPESPRRPSLRNISSDCCRKRNGQESKKLPQVIQWAVLQALPGSPTGDRKELSEAESTVGRAGTVRTCKTFL